MYQLDQSLNMENTDEVKLLRRHIFIIALFLLTIVSLAAGVMLFDWYIIEMSALFLIMGIIAGIIYGMWANQIAEKFVDGCKDRSEERRVGKEGRCRGWQENGKKK